MQRRLVIPIAACLGVLGGSGSAGAFPRPALSLAAGHMSGSTLYRISFPIGFEGGRYTAASELEFPVDAFMAGAELSLGPSSGGRWFASCRALRNVTDPTTPVLDTDCLSPGPSGSRWVFSYTESDPRLTAWAVELEVGRRLLDGRSASLSALAAYRYLHLSYEVFGAQGWYDPAWQGEDTGQEPQYLDEDVHVLDYRVTHHLPLLGVSFVRKSGPKLSTTLRVWYSPFALSRDSDDHLLRYKTTRTEASGPAYAADLVVEARLQSEQTGRETLVSARVGWLRVETEGDQTQEWYGDDPLGESGGEAGAKVSGIDTEIEVKALAVSLSIGWRF